MKRIFKGAIPKNYAFFHNILFSLIEERYGQGLRKYMCGKYDKDGQHFKVTINIERIKK